jgi:uncharacterized protein (DUF1501 family)
MDQAVELLSRRRLLELGVTGYLGLNLGGFFRAQALTAEASTPRVVPVVQARIKACIVIFYYGGPSHIDMFDMKPNAPAEVRGEFQPIATSVPGIQICEHLPRTAQIMHRLCLIRSMHHTNRLHDSASTEILTGRQSPTGDREEFAPIEQFFPCHGAALSYCWKGRQLEVSHAALPFVFHNVVDVPCQGGGFLGSSFDPLQIDVDVTSRSYRAGALLLPSDMAATRLQGRRGLLGAIETQPTVLDPLAAGPMRRFYDKAYRLLESEALRKAVDISREDPRTRERYGFGPAPLTVGEGGGGGNGAELGQSREMRGQNLLLARRLVEAGVPFVNVYDFKQQGQNWDAHFKCFNQHRTHLLPLADQGFSALIEDLELRGLLDSTLVVALGEFGRTPQINKEAGRDHWPDCYTIVLAGGGVKGGYVHGASDRIGAYPAADPVTPADLAATIFWRFGIDPATEIHDPLGRPYKLADGQPLKQLFADT